MNKHLSPAVAALTLLAALLSLTAQAGSETGQDKHAVKALKITVLVTNVGGDPRAGYGEWGYSALVEVDGHKILYDTGASPDLVLHNARALHIDLSDVEDVVLSHNHWDHVGGLMTLRQELSKTNPKAISRVHVGAQARASGQTRRGQRGTDHYCFHPLLAFR